MNILDLYQQYNLMPNLIEHQIRVASVGKFICDHVTNGSVDCQQVTTTLLLHDMGNIIKFDLNKFPQFCEPEGFEYWEAVRQDCIKKYGTDEHQAHLKIARELGFSERIIHLIDMVDFDNLITNKNSDDLTQKICAYADLRVGPFGILSLKERLEDGRKRYEISKEEERWDLVDAAMELEQQIFSQTDVHPEDINDQVVKKYESFLKNFELTIDSSTGVEKG